MSIILELNNLYNMDCMVGMAQFPDNYFDLAIVDPPYRNKNRPTKSMRRIGGEIQSFGKKPGKEYFNELFRVSKNQIIWGVNNFPIFDYKGFVVWEKLSISDTFSMSMAEIAYISEGLGTTSKIFKYIPQDKGRIHPVQKPVALYTWLLKHYAKEGDIILDTHAGSASSLIACYIAGFNYIGFEINPQYFYASQKRLDAERAQLRLWDYISSD